MIQLYTVDNTYVNKVGGGVRDLRGVRCEQSEGAPGRVLGLRGGWVFERDFEEAEDKQEDGQPWKVMSAPVELAIFLSLLVYNCIILVQLLGFAVA